MRNQWQEEEDARWKGALGLRKYKEVSGTMRGKLERLEVATAMPLPVSELTTRSVWYSDQQLTTKPVMWERVPTTVMGKVFTYTTKGSKPVLEGEISHEYLLAHLQYIEDNQVLMTNIVNKEVHHLNWHSKRNRE